MLDKSLPKKSIVMRMEAAAAARLAPSEPVAGYRIRPFAPGDERHWARIETAVGEFTDETAARLYFERIYLAGAAERSLFAVAAQGDVVATATAWAVESPLGYQAQLQWVAVDPAHQGKGLGRAIVTAALRRLARLEPQQAILLHTQTWSHRALGLYYRLGFRFCRTEGIAMHCKSGPGVKIYPNEFEEAMEVLRQKIAPSTIDEWNSTAL